MRLSLNSDKYVLRGSKIRPCSKTQGFLNPSLKILEPQGLIRYVNYVGQK